MTRWDVADAVVSSTLTPTERLVMMMLIRRADTETAAIPPEFSPSLTTLTRDTGLSRSSVMRTLNSLEAGGWIVRGRPPKHEQIRDHARTEYLLQVPGARPTVDLGVGPQWSQVGPTTDLGVGPQGDQARATVGLNHSPSSSSSGSSAASSARDAHGDVWPTRTAYSAGEMQPCPECWARTGEACEDAYSGQPRSHYHQGRLPRPECA